MAANHWNEWGGMDDRYLETIPEADSLKSKTSSISTLPSEGQFRAMPQAVQRLSRVPNAEPTWAQSSHVASKWQQSDDERRGSYSDISPPSTPRKSWGGSVDETPVSPIEAIPPVPRLQPRAPLSEQPSKSQIPRRVPLRTEVSREPTRWDAYSGEWTTDGTGIASSVRPGTIPLEEQYPNLKPRTREILASLRARHPERTPVADNNAASVPGKAPWKGASGRAAIVDPVQDTPSARRKPLISSKLAVEPTNVATSEIEQVVRPPPIALTIRTAPSSEDLKPVVPLKITKSRTPSPPHSLIPSRRNGMPSPSDEDYYTESPSLPSPQSAETKMLQSPFRSPQPPRIFEEPPLPLSSTRTDSPQQDPSPETPRTPSPERYLPIASISTRASQPMEPEISRFSWTTYATSVTESPGSAAHILRNESPPPPVPVMPEIHKRPVPPTAVFNEHLYVDAAAARSQGTIVIMRKPVPVPSISIPSPAVKRGGQGAGELTTSKTLPQIPPELEAADKISGLEAQIEAIARRKHNLSRIIANLKNDLAKNRVNYDLYKRREVEANITSYEKEMQAATNDEHDIGLLLHRAVKKRDRDDGYELPTGLWIRRVTS